MQITNRQKDLLVKGGLASIALLLLSIIFYLIFFYNKMPVKDLAHKFCECSRNSSVKSAEDYVESREGFRYIKPLEQEVKTEFAYYQNRLSHDDKLYYIKAFQEEILKECPEVLNKSFTFPLEY